jgi:hypothetical protein
MVGTPVDGRRPAPPAHGAYGETEKRIMLIDLVDDYTDYVNNNGVVDADALEARIDELKGFREDYEAEGGQMGTDEAEELRLLLNFRAEVERATGGSFMEATIVAEREFEKYVRYYAEQDYGVGPESMGDYVDWSRYADDQRKEFTSLVLDGQQVWVK